MTIQENLCKILLQLTQKNSIGPNLNKGNNGKEMIYQL